MRRQLAFGALLLVTVLVLLPVISLFLPYRNVQEVGKVICPTVNEPHYYIPPYFWKLFHGTDKESEIHLNILKTERNTLSKELNMLKRKLGQQECEKDEKKETNEAGGWCRTSSREDGGQHMTDMELVKALSNFLKNKMVGSFGDGPGVYKRELLKLDAVRSYDAYDGAPYCEETSEGRVKFMDLTVPQYGIPMYDWIISLEVAEHIPKEFESIYVDNLVRHSKEGIILSWAVPDQGGLAHVNNRPLTYVISLMEMYGYSHDVNSSKILQDASSFQWLRMNINVFKREVATYIKDLEKWYA